MKRIAIIGAGGHGKVCAEIAELNGYEEIVFLDDDRDRKECLKYPVIGRSEEAARLFADGYDIFVAIGNNRIRKEICGKQSKLATLIHPNAVISNTCVIKEGTVIMANAVINACCKIGRCCIINTSATIDHDCEIGNYAHISPGAHIGGTCHIGEESWIGLGSSIINDIEIGENVIVGAGSVVIRKVENKMKIAGNPSKIIGGGVINTVFNTVLKNCSLMCA